MKRRYSTYNNDFYHSKEWRTLRLEALRRDGYLCQECLKRGDLTPATTVHHIRPLRIDDSRALDLSNLETVCPACHNRLHRERGTNIKQKKKYIVREKNKEIIKFRQNPEIF